MPNIVIALDSLTRWATIMGLLAAVITLLGILIKGTWKIFRAVDGALESLSENTKAIRQLSERMDRMEARS